MEVEFLMDVIVKRLLGADVRLLWRKEYTSFRAGPVSALLRSVTMSEKH